MSVVVVVGNPRPGSRTGRFAAEFAAALAEGEPVRVIDLATAAAVSFDEGLVAPDEPVADALEAVAGARLLIAVSPSYKGTYTGLLKLFFDQFGNEELRGVGAAVAVGIAASPDHVRATADDLGRLLAVLAAPVAAVVGVDEAEFASGVEDAARTHADKVRTSLRG